MCLLQIIYIKCFFFVTQFSDKSGICRNDSRDEVV